MGRFLDSAEFAKAHGMRTSEKLRRLPGLMVVYSRQGSGATVVTTRSLATVGRCGAAVWIDGINVGTGFNVNELHPNEIAAVEWYAGTATIPAQFSGGPTRRGQPPVCGVLVIWLR